MDINRNLTVLTLLALFSLPVSSWAKEPVDINLGGRFAIGNWNGENKRDGSKFDSEAAQIGADLTLRYGKFFGGIGIFGGQYTFSGDAPDRPTRPNPAGTKVRINRGEVNLIAGYNVIPQLSVFLNLQQILNEWDGENYEIKYNGFGFGVSSNLPLSREWVLYGSFGIVPVKITQSGDTIGDGRGGSLELGGTYIINPATTVSVSIRGQNREFDYDTAPDQVHTTGALQFRFNKSF